MKLQHVAAGVVARDCTAGFEWNAGMAPDREIELHHRMRVAACGCEVAVRLLQDRRLGRTAVFELARAVARVEDDRQLLDLDFDQIGRVFRKICVGREYGCDRLADVAHALPGQNGLAIGCQPFDARQPEIDRRNIGDIGRRPHRRDLRQCPRRGAVDRDDPAMRVARPHHSHVQHVGKSDVGGKPSAARHQRPVLEARNRTSDHAHVRSVSARRPHAARLEYAAASPETRRSTRRRATARR